MTFLKCIVLSKVTEQLQFSLKITESKETSSRKKLALLYDHNGGPDLVSYMHVMWLVSASSQPECSTKTSGTKGRDLYIVIITEEERGGRSREV